MTSWIGALRQRLNLRILSGLLNRRWFAYGTILALQLRVVWGMWDFKDLPLGDTSYYFIQANHWFSAGTGLFTSAPLYTFFYGSLLHVTQDTYAATILHRLLIVLALSVLALGLMRRLLPAGLAWLMAAWWVILPVNYNALYEVHLFGLIPGVAAAWVILRRPGAWARGTALAILWAATVMVRNEQVIAAGLFSLACLAAEIAARRRDRPSLWAAILPYAVPLALTLAVGLLFSALDPSSPSQKAARLHDKDTQPICKITAFNYLQRHPDQPPFDPWNDCPDFMQATFGAPAPTFMEAFQRNPQALLDNLILWNVQLIPAGLQVLLFNATSGPLDPDFGGSPTEVWYPLPLSLALGGLLIAGAVVGWRDRRWWWEHWLRERAWGWLALAALAASTLAVMLAVRPRPEYMFGLSVLILAAAGTSLMVVSRGLRVGRLAPALPVLMLALIVAAPGEYLRPDRPPRILLLDVQRLSAYEAYFTRSSTVFVSAGNPPYSQEICNYIARNATTCRGIDVESILDEARATSLGEALERRRATLFYAGEDMARDPLVREFFDRSSALGWQRIAVFRGVDGMWFLLAKP